MQTSLNKELILILDAKEKRTALKIEFAGKGLNSLTLTLNIPGIPKSNELINEFFRNTLKELKNYLIAHRVKVLFHNEIIVTDHAGDFYLLPFEDGNFISPEKMKEITENFEKKHKLGRLIDIDIFCRNKGHLSSKFDKFCYFCGKHSAISCMRNKRHSYSEIRLKIFSDIQKYLDQKKADEFTYKISALALRSILYEVSLSPKPGLVDFSSSGAHKDMNYYSFLNSSSALSAYFRSFCLAGFQFSGNWKNALPTIRKIGLEAEKAMFESTNGANTQKGIIFLFGISLFAYSYLFAHKKILSKDNFRTTIKKICKNIVANELNAVKNNDATHGEHVFDKFGNAGIRQEAENAFPVIFETAVPFLSSKLKTNTFNNQKVITELLKTALLKIMSVNNDSNILYRSNLITLEKIKKLAQQAVDDYKLYDKLCTYCLEHNISPGGSADLLALSLFIHFVDIDL